eukprot:Platyproteum_vivax@DN6974_c0_g1_i6.p2
MTPPYGASSRTLLPTSASPVVVRPHVMPHKSNSRQSSPAPVVFQMDDPSEEDHTVVSLAPGEPVEFEDVRLGEKLGEGGFGTVHQGWYLGVEVAVKMLHKDQFPEVLQTKRKDVLREIKDMQSLDHPSLVQFIGACLEEGHICIVTELMSGGSLYAMLHENGTKMETEMQLRMVTQLAEGVGYLHSKHVIHRDLKSSNVVT